MKMQTVEELLHMDDGERVAGARGKISAIYDRKTGQKKDGDEFSVQNVMLKGKDGDEIKVVLWNHKPVNRSLRGASVWILAEEGKKGPTGMTIRENEYNGKVSLQLHVDERATLTENEPGADDQDQDDEDSTEPPGGWQGAARGRRDNPEDRPKKRARDEDDEEPPKPKKKTPLAAVSDVRGQVKRLAVLYEICQEVAEGIVNRFLERTAGTIKMGDNFYGSIVASLFIESNKRGLDCELPEKMPRPGDDGQDPSERTEGGDDRPDLGETAPREKAERAKRAKAEVGD